MARITDFWTGKTQEQIKAAMETQERDFYRDLHSFGDNRNHAELQVGDFSFNAVTDTLSEDDTKKAHGRIAKFFAKVKAWQKANDSKANLVDTLSAMVAFSNAPEVAEERLMELGRALGIRRNSAAKRLATVERHKKILQEIAREIWAA